MFYTNSTDLGAGLHLVDVLSFFHQYPCLLCTGAASPQVLCAVLGTTG